MRSPFALLLLAQACTVDRTSIRHLVAIDGVEPEEPGMSESHVVCGLDPITCATRVSGGVHLVGTTLVLDMRSSSGGDLWFDTPPPGATYGGPFTTVTIDASSFDEGAETTFDATAMLFVSGQEFQPIPFTEGTVEVVSVGEALGPDGTSDPIFAEARLCWNLTFGEVSPDTTYAKYHGCQTFP